MLFNVSASFSQTLKTAKTGNWSNAATWTPSGVPASNDSIIIPAGVKLTVDITDTAAAITFLGDKVLKPDTLTINASTTLTITNSINVKQYKVDTSSTVNISGFGALITGNLFCGTSGLSPTGNVATNIVLNISISTINITSSFKIYNPDNSGNAASVPTVNVKTPCNLSVSIIQLIQTGIGTGPARLITFLTETGTTINLSGDSIPIIINSEVTLKTGKVVFTINTTSTVNFNGNQIQIIPVTISNTGSGGTTNTIPINYGNIKINNSAGATLGAAVTSTNVTGSILVGDLAAGSLFKTNNNAIGLGASDSLKVYYGSTMEDSSSVVSFGGASGKVIIDGLFKTSNTNGFSGTATAAINSTNNPTITLGSNSTIEYNAASNQAVTDRNYANLTISNSSGIKTFTLSATTRTISKNLTINSNASFTFGGGARTINILGDWVNNSSGTFDPGTSTVVFNGINQEIKGTNSTSFNNLTITSSGITALAINTTVASNLSVTTGTFDLGSYTCNRTSAGGTLSLSASTTLKIGGTNSFPSNYNTNTITANSTVEYYGSTQTVASQNYSNLIINGNGTKTLANNTTITGNFTLSKGIFELGNYTFARATAGGTLKLDTSTTLRIGSTNSFPSNFTIDTLYARSTVDYYGGAQTIAAQNYSNLKLTAVSSSKKTFANATSAFKIRDTLSVSSNAVASLPMNNTYSAGTLYIGGLGRKSGTWGGTSSSAQFKNSMYFDTAKGIVVITVDSRPTITITATGPSKIYGTALNAKRDSSNFSYTGNLGTGDSIVSVYLTPDANGINANTIPDSFYTITPSLPRGNTSFNANVDNDTSYIFNYIIFRDTVDKKGLTILNANADKTYDGTTAATITGTLSGIVNSDDVSFTGVGTFDTKNVGALKPISSTYYLTGTKASYYYLIQPSGLTARISQAVIKITASYATKVYDGNNSCATLPYVSLGQVMAVDSLNFIQNNFIQTFTSSNVINNNAAKIGVSLKSTFDASVLNNYSYTTISINSGSITPKPLTIGSPSITSKVYNRTTAIDSSIRIGALSGMVGTDSFGVTITAASYENATAGVNKIVNLTYRLDSLSNRGRPSNYSLTGTGTSTITKKEVTVTGATASDKVYDGTTTASVSGGILNGVISGDTVTLTQSGTFDNKNVGVNKPVTSTCSLAGANASNYLITQPTLSAKSISPKPIIISGSRPYDRTRIASAHDLIITNKVSGDDISLVGSGYSSIKDTGRWVVSPRVNNARGNSGSTPVSNFTIQIPSPSNGNTLIAIVSTRHNYINTVNSIEQTGANWQRATQSTGTMGVTTEIWYATNITNGGNTVRFNLSATTYASAIITEYAGILYATSPVDQVAHNYGTGLSISSGKINTTAKTNELLIGGIGINNSISHLTSTSNYFNTYDSSLTTNSVASANVKLYALEKIQMIKDTANAGATLSVSSNWSAALVAFKPIEELYGVAFTFSGTDAGNYVYTALADSITISPDPKATSSSQSISACESYYWNGVTYTSSGVKSWLGENVIGSDSTAYLNLTIKQKTSSSQTLTACDSLLWNGNYYSTSGIKTWVGPNAVGCDSTVTLNLTIKKSTSSITNITACDSYRWGAITYTTSGVRYYDGTNAAGCDSTAQLNLTIKRSTTSSVSAEIFCNSYTWNGVTYTSSGSYDYNTLNAAGCDSTVTLQLTLRPNVTITSPNRINGPTLICPYLYSQNAAKYWVNRNNSQSVRYSWILPNGAQFLPNSDTTGDTIYVTFNGAIWSHQGNGRIYVAAKSGNCSSRKYASLRVWRTNTYPMGSIQGVSNVCTYVGKPDSIATYKVTAGRNYTGYLWTVPVGVRIVYPVSGITGGPNDTLIRVVFDNNFTNGRFSVKGISPCVNMVKYFTVTGQKPASPSEILCASDAVNICPVGNQNRIYTYSISPVPNALFYQWVLPLHVRLVGSQSQLYTRTVTVVFDSGFTTSVFKVRSAANCGFSMYCTKTISTNYGSKPGIISGPTDLCYSMLGDGGNIYSIRKLPSATSYLWSVSPGLTISHLSTNPSEDTIVKIFKTSAFSAANYNYISVKSSNNCNYGDSNVLRIWGASLPSSFGNITGPTSLCQLPLTRGQDSIIATYSIQRNNSANNYIWSTTAGRIIWYSTRKDTIQIKVQKNYPDFSVRVMPFNTCGGGSVKSLNIVQSLPSYYPYWQGLTQQLIQSCPNRKYSYSVENRMKFSNYIEWTVSTLGGGTIESGQGTNTIIVNYPNNRILGSVRVKGINNCGVGATYSVAVDLNACSNRLFPNLSSNQNDVIYISFDSISNKNTFEVFPNPSRSVFNVKSAANNKSIIKLMNVSGVVLYERIVMPGERIQIGEQLHPGIYFLQMIGSGTVQTKKIIKL